MNYKFILLKISILCFFLFTISSCSKPAETKEEFIQKGIIMSDTLLKNLNAQLKDAELTADSAIKAGFFVPPPPATVATTNTSAPHSTLANQK